MTVRIPWSARICVARISLQTYHSRWLQLLSARKVGWTGASVHWLSWSEWPSSCSYFCWKWWRNLILTWFLTGLGVGFAGHLSFRKTWGDGWKIHPAKMTYPFAVNGPIHFIIKKGAVCVTCSFLSVTRCYKLYYTIALHFSLVIKICCLPLFCLLVSTPVLSNWTCILFCCRWYFMFVCQMIFNPSLCLQM